MSIKDNEVEVDIFNRFKDDIVEEEVLDIRTADRPYESGADAFFCDLTECKKEQDVLKGMAGLMTNGERVESFLKEKINDYFCTLNEIKELEKTAKEQKLNAEALLLALNYDDIKWQVDSKKKFLRATKVKNSNVVVKNSSLFTVYE